MVTIGSTILQESSSSGPSTKVKLASKDLVIPYW